MSSDNDDDLTDITALPDFDEEEDDQSFASLDELAKEVGFEDDQSPPDIPSPPDFDDFNDSPDSFEPEETSPFEDFGEEESSFGEEESSFGEEESSFGEEESSFGEEESSFGEEESSFGEEESSFGEEEPSYGEEEPSFGEEESEFDEDKTDPNIDISALHDKDSNLENEQKPESQLISEAELKPAPPITEKIKKTPIIEEVKTHKTAPEQFEEFKNFARSMTYSNFSSEGNPPFSIILKNLTYLEDIDEITELLIELKVIDESSEETTKQMLGRGQLLIPRLSEYAAIVLCHKLRRFDLEILMGLTEEVNPPKSYDSNDRGLSSKRSILANKKHNFSFNKENQIDEILITTLQHLNDYKIVKYLGVITDHKTISSNSLKDSTLEDELIQHSPEGRQSELYIDKIKRENQLAGISQNEFNFLDFYKDHDSKKRSIELDHIYKELTNNLKLKAKTAKANGIVGISYQVSQLSKDDELGSNKGLYQISCTGNMVWIEKT